MAEARFTAADVAYIRNNYVTLAELCAGRAESVADVEALIAAGHLPRPSYVRDDGTAMFPHDYFRLVDDAGGPAALPAHFAARHSAAVQANGAGDEFADDWAAYLDGTYGVCLREVTPETIVRKTVLVASLSELLRRPRARDGDWRRVVREQVDELDELEREFAPDYDRGSDREPPTRDRLIRAARERYPDLFAADSLPTQPPIGIGGES